jgi:hypothetical protein
MEGGIAQRRSTTNDNANSSALKPREDDEKKCCTHKNRERREAAERSILWLFRASRKITVTKIQVTDCNGLFYTSLLLTSASHIVIIPVTHYFILYLYTFHITSYLYLLYILSCNARIFGQFYCYATYLLVQPPSNSLEQQPTVCRDCPPT